MATKFYGGTIYQGDEAFSETIYVSDEGQVIPEKDFYNSKNQIEVNLNGSLVLPAFRDGHAHPLFSGREAKGLDIGDCKSEADIISKLKDFRKLNPESVWIDGAVFDRSMPAVFHRTTLDRAVSEIPVVLHGDDHHTLWVNSKALEVAGVMGVNTSNRQTPGIDFDEQGVPTGILREWPAMRLVLDISPEETLESDVENLLWADRKLAAAGVIECFDGWIDQGMAETYLAAADSGELSLDYKLCFRADQFTFTQDLPYIRQMRTETNLRQQLDGNSIKFFVDGVFGSATAMVSEPYDSDGGLGSPVWDFEVLKKAILLANEELFQIHIHVIGDAALALALDILEEIPQEKLAYRPILIHAELTNEVLLRRLNAVDGIACVQPFWAQHNGMLNSCLHHLGTQRLSSLYAFKEMLDLGVAVAFSSDWPVSSYEPLKGIAVAVNRREYEKQEQHNPSQAITLEQAVAAYTTGVQAMRPGLQSKFFDLGAEFDAVVLNTNIFEIPSMQIAESKILATYKSGRKIF
jgi:predicted amidohydrolase YtcJ